MSLVALLDCSSWNLFCFPLVAIYSMLNVQYDQYKTNTRSLPNTWSRNWWLATSAAGVKLGVECLIDVRMRKKVCKVDLASRCSSCLEPIRDQICFNQSDRVYQASIWNLFWCISIYHKEFPSHLDDYDKINF